MTQVNVSTANFAPTRARASSSPVPESRVDRAPGAGNDHPSHRKETRHRSRNHQDLDIQEEGLNTMVRSRRGRSERIDLLSRV